MERKARAKTCASSAILVASLVSGKTQRQVAREHGVSVATVARASALLRLSPASISEIKQGMVVPAARAVHAGLACEEDAYKRGSLGVQVLKGIGVFSDTPTTSIQQIIMATPASMRDAFLDACCDDATKIGEGEMPQGPGESESGVPS